MASAKEIRNRIDGIADTMKITNAMYLISSTKLRKAREELANTEPYFYSLQAVINRVLRHLPEGYTHPYLDTRESVSPENVRCAIVCITADKGLAGAYNHNVLSMTEEMRRPDDQDILYVIGEVGRQYFERHHIRIDEQFRYTVQKPTLHRARGIARRLIDDYRSQKVDEVCLIYTKMGGGMAMQPEILRLLPLTRLAGIRMDEMQQGQTAAGIIREEFLR